MYKKLKWLGINSLILIMLNACTTNINGDFCFLYEPVYLDYEKDTPETIHQTDRNNAVFEDICEK